MKLCGKIFKHWIDFRLHLLHILMQHKLQAIRIMRVGCVVVVVGCDVDVVEVGCEL